MRFTCTKTPPMQTDPLRKLIAKWHVAFRCTASLLVLVGIGLFFVHFGSAIACANFPVQTSATGQWPLFAYMGIGCNLGLLALLAGIVCSFGGGPDGWVLILGGLMAVPFLALLWLPALVGVLVYWSITGRIPSP